MSPSDFSAAFKGSPMKRAKLRGLERNAAVALGNVGTPEDVEVLARALDVPSHSSTSTPSDRRVAWPSAHANASAGTPALIPLRPRGRTHRRPTGTARRALSG